MYSDRIKRVLIEVNENESSLISSVEWVTANKGTLYITFCSGGTYSYKSVPFNIFDKLIKSDSMGSFFHKNIKDKYTTNIKE